MFCAGGDVGIFFGENTDDASGDFLILLSSPTISIPNSLVGRLVKV